MRGPCASGQQGRLTSAGKRTRRASGLACQTSARPRLSSWAECLSDISGQMPPIAPLSLPYLTLPSFPSSLISHPTKLETTLTSISTMLARQSTDGSKDDGKSSPQKDNNVTSTVLAVPETITENDENAKFGTTSAAHRRLVSQIDYALDDQLTHCVALLSCSRYGFRYWETPGLINNPFPQHGKGLGSNEGFLAATTNAAFTITGPEYLTMVTGETKNPRHVPPSAFRGKVWRIDVFFCGGALCVRIIVP